MIRADEVAEDLEMFPGQTVARCECTGRPARSKDMRLADRIHVLAEPANWRDVPGPHAERAVMWQETSKWHGYQILDAQGRVLHKIPHVNLPRWSPDGRWLAVSRWSRELPYHLALINVATGEVMPILQVEHLGSCAWSPDSRRLAFVGLSYRSDGPSSIGWVSVPDTSVHVVAQDFNFRFECQELQWSRDSRHFVALMHREYEHDDIRITDLWMFGLTPGVCRLTATPEVEESNVGWIDDRRVMFRDELAGSETVLELRPPH